jgi:3-oxosteroid 1-dehydrogenase
MNGIWDKEVEVLIVGSGAGAMASGVFAAHRGARTLIVEKSALYGGTSATSGGGVWIPASDSALEQGQQDTPEEAYTYIKELTGNTVADDRIRAFVQNARVMKGAIEAVSALRFTAIPYTDYQAEKPGGKMGYRSHACNTIHASELSPEDFATLRTTHRSAMLFGKIPWTIMESAPMITRGPGWKSTMARVLLRYYSDITQRLRSPRSRFIVFGSAIAAHLKNALNRTGGELWLNTALIDLLRDESGVVTGALVQKNGKVLRIRATRGVILGAGGFERNQAMRDRYLPGESRTTFSASQDNNTGDAIEAGIRIGASTDLMDEAWWAPTVHVPGEDTARPLFFERALPGCIIVNQAGDRYMNEAKSYDIAGKAMIEADRPDARTIPSWIILDARFRKKYPMGPIIPLLPDWMQSPAARKAMKKASTIEGLARMIGVDPGRLSATIAKINRYASTGVDEDFHRGSAPYDRYYGDQSVKPNPNLAPLDCAPFYALQVYPGDIGTKGGLATDDRARVIDMAGEPISGLYAIGNTAASVMGPSYPGAGSTLAPAMTFGMLAVYDMLGEPA